MREFLRILLLSIFAIIASAQPVTARALISSEQTALNARRDQFLGHIRTNSYGELFRIVPPRFLAALAQKVRVTEAQMISEVSRRARITLAGVEFLEVNLPTTRLDFQDARLANGQVVTWAYTTSTVVLRIENQQQTSRSTVLILRDGGQWYLTRMTADSLGLIRQFYPFVPAPPRET